MKTKCLELKVDYSHNWTLFSFLDNKLTQRLHYLYYNVVTRDYKILEKKLIVYKSIKMIV